MPTARSPRARSACSRATLATLLPTPVSVPVTSTPRATLGDMFTSQSLSGDKPQQYAQLAAQARALLAGEHDRIANAANLAALVYHALPELNWAGFYFFDGTELVVGPFQGQPACVRIPLDQGGCGAAASRRRTRPVGEGGAVAAHIACDSASRAELVVPLLT